MAVQVQFRRGNTSSHSTFTGAEGEITVDTEKKIVVVHDGSTAGGFPVANSSVASTAYSNAVSYADTIAGTAYSNAVSYADTIAGTAYSNAVSTASSDATTKAATAYSNAVSYAASNTYVNSTFATIANPSVTGTLTIDSAVVQDYSTATTTSTSQAAADTFSTITYRSAKYIVQVTNGTDYHVTEIMIFHDGTTAYITEYGTMYDNIPLATFSVDVLGDSDIVRLLVTPASATSTVFKMFKTLIVV